MFNPAYIGLVDRSLLHMSLNQVELALKNAASKARTPVSMYQTKICTRVILSILQSFLHFLKAK